MNELPEGWVSAPINELILLNPKNKCADELEVGFVPMSLLGKEFHSAIGFERKLWAEVKKGYTHFADGDVLLAKITPCFENGKAGLVANLPNGIGAGSTEYFVCRPIPEALLPKYLLAYLKTSEFMRTGELSMTGSVGQKRLPKEYLVQANIPLAPLAEQKRIADKLDALLARVDRCRARLDRVPLILKRFRQAVLAAATSGQLTEDWREARSNLGAWQQIYFKELICDGPQNGLYKHISTYGSGTRILRIDMFYDGEVRSWDEMKRLSVSKEEIEAFGLAIGDIVINRVNSPPFVGKSALIRELPEPCVFESNMMRIRVDQKQILPDYCIRFLNAPQGLTQLRKNVKHAVNQSSINQQDIKSVIVNLPPLEEQHEIVRRVEILFAYADRLAARYQAARAQVERLTPALLAKAFRGELVPQDPADEPAAVLLARARGRE